MKARRPRARSSTSAEQRRLSYLEFRTGRGGSRLCHLGTRVVISLSPDPRVRFVLGWHSPGRHFHLRAVDADQCPRLIFRFGQVVVGRRLVDVAACDPPVDVVPLAVVPRFKKNLGLSLEEHLSVTSRFLVNRDRNARLASQVLKKGRMLSRSDQHLAALENEPDRNDARGSIRADGL